MPISRREFLHGSTTLAAGTALGAMLLGRPSAVRAAEAGEKIVVGIMGLGRGKSLARTFASRPNAVVAYVCDVDQQRAHEGASTVSETAGNTPRIVGDFREILDDRSVDALVIAAPDHWHAPATILACAAGKHVYCEKPASHNPQEGEWQVAAARKYNRVVQLGTQRRSMPVFQEAIARLHGGAIGRVLLARAWYFNPRPSIGRGQPADVPSWLDYSLWQGPAPHRAYRDNVVHYNWHWFWHWGTSELGNNGVHTVDICRWGLGVDYPLRVSSAGGRYAYDDDQETPDTNIATFDFGHCAITWEGRSFYRRRPDDPRYEIAFYGDQGTLTIGGGNYTIYDSQGKQTGSGSSDTSDTPHVDNFIACIKSGQRPNADIEEGHKSTLLCHLGNIAYRTGRMLHLDPQSHRIVGAPEAQELWGREYRPGWEPKV